MRIVWWTVRRITNKNLGVNGLRKCFLPHLSCSAQMAFLLFKYVLEESFLGEGVGVGVREGKEGGRGGRGWRGG